MWKLLRNSKWTLMWNNFNRVFGTCKLLYESWVSKQLVFTPLYRGLKDTLEIASTSKKSRSKLDQITDDLMPDLVIVPWRSNFKSIPSLEDTGAGTAVVLVLLQTQNRVVEIDVVHFVQFVLFQRSPKYKHPMPSNPFELAVALYFQSSAMMGVFIWTTFEVLQSSSFWWSSDASDNVSF